MNKTFSVEGQLVDVLQEKIYYARITVEGERITDIVPLPNATPSSTHFLLPGFIDAHVHIESSMLTPSAFARLAVVHGTVATVSDPHEIANVCGMKGIEFMIENGNTVPFKFNFGAPSCVPATTFETAGATISSADIEILMRRKEILYLSEMMNFPGVLHGDQEVIRKIAAAKKNGKPVDGHAPGLRGETAKKYIDAGISTDHECFTQEEALDKLQQGMQVIIREGSAAKNFEALVDLLHDHADRMMFCSDDKHPDSLVEGHINQLCTRAVARGIDVYKVLKAACVNPVNHYKLKCGLLRKNDFADFIVLKDLKDFEVQATYINGQLVAENGKSLILPSKSQVLSVVNQFNCSKKKPSDFIVPSTDKEFIPAIEALDGQLITKKILVRPLTSDGHIISDVENDLLQLVVVNRYKNAPVSKTFIKNFGLIKGALASSVAHDSHNIVAVGVDVESICQAVNLIIESKGGISCVDGQQQLLLPLPIGGLMSQADGYEVADRYAAIDQMAKSLGSQLSAPYMTLSFMALLVIPHLKLSDLGLFDGDSFAIIR